MASGVDLTPRELVPAPSMPACQPAIWRLLEGAMVTCVGDALRSLSTFRRKCPHICWWCMSYNLARVNVVHLEWCGSVQVTRTSSLGVRRRLSGLARSASSSTPRLHSQPPLSHLRSLPSMFACYDINHRHTCSFVHPHQGIRPGLRQGRGALRKAADIVHRGISAMYGSHPLRWRKQSALRP